MDEILTKVWKNKAVLWKIVIIVESAGFSVLCAFITQDIVITSVYILITAFIDIMAEIIDFIHLDGIIYNMFKMNKYIKYLFFVGFALLPTVCGLFIGELTMEGIEDLPVLFFINLFPNVMGAMIVCSVIGHISKLGYMQFVYVLIRSKKELLSVFIRVVFWGCYLNAVNYEVHDTWNYANIVNSIYLFFVISFGILAMGSFLLRLIDKQSLNKTAKQVYPTLTLFFAVVFLFSCSVAPLKMGIGKHEPFLLGINTITAFVTSLFILKFVIRKTENKSKKYPFFEFLILGFAMFANSFYSLYKWNGTGDVIGQIRSGICILVVVLSLLLYINYKQSSCIREQE